MVQRSFSCRLKRTVWKLNCVKETKSVKVHQGIKMRLCRNKRELKLVWIDFLPLFRIALTCWEPSAIYALLCVKTVTWLCQRMAKVNDVTYFYFSLIGESCHSFPTLAESFCVVALQTLFVNISHLFLWLSLLHCRPPWTLNFSFPAFPVRCSKSTDLLYNIITLVGHLLYPLHIYFSFKKIKQGRNIVLKYFWFNLQVWITQRKLRKNSLYRCFIHLNLSYRFSFIGWGYKEVSLLD